MPKTETLELALRLRTVLEQEYEKFLEELERARDIVWNVEPGSKVAEVTLKVTIDPSEEGAHKDRLTKVAVGSAVTEKRQDVKKGIEFGPEESLFQNAKG